MYRVAGITFVVGLVVFIVAGCGKKDGDDGAGKATQSPPKIVKPGKPGPTDAAPNQRSKARFAVQVTVSQGERSKDSHSTSVYVTILDSKFFLETQPKGKRSKAPSMIDTRIELSDADIARLTQSIRDKKLLEAKSLNVPDTPSGAHKWINARVTVKVDRVENRFTLVGATTTHGAATALAATDTYKNVLLFVGELTQLAQDKKGADHD